MKTTTLYRGVWPQNVNKLAKYQVKFIDDDWRIAVLYDIGQGERLLAIEGGAPKLVACINAVKITGNGQPGGPFYINEFHHIIVPIKGDPASGTGSHYYFAGRFDGEFRFHFEGKPLTTKPIGHNGQPLSPGDRWIGPRPGIPHVLAAGGSDIYYETPALTDSDPPEVRPSVTRRVYLSKVLGNRALVNQACKAVVNIRGHKGGRFYVNEHGAMFTPVDGGYGNGIDYIYCGQIDRYAWFPEPAVSEDESAL